MIQKIDQLTNDSPNQISFSPDSNELSNYFNHQNHNIAQLFHHIIYQFIDMKNQDIEIDQNITYSLTTESFNRPLRIINHTDSVYVFKIKTNQKTVISLQSTHDFLRPHCTADIVIKMVVKPAENQQLKLEVNYAVASEMDLQNNDSKMMNTPKENIQKKVFIIKRNQNSESNSQKIENSPKKEESISFTSSVVKPYAGKKEQSEVSKQVEVPSSPVKIESKPSSNVQDSISFDSVSIHNVMEKSKSFETILKPITQKNNETDSFLIADDNGNEWFKQKNKTGHLTVSNTQNQEEKTYHQLIAKIQKEANVVNQAKKNLQEARINRKHDSLLPFIAIVASASLAFLVGSASHWVILG